MITGKAGTKALWPVAMRGARALGIWNSASRSLALTRVVNGRGGLYALGLLGVC